VGRHPTEHLAEAVAVVGTKAFLLTDYGGLHLLDVSSPAQVAPIGWFSTTNSTRRLRQAGDRVAVADEAQGLRIAAPSQETGAYELFGGFTKSDGFAEGIVVAGDLAFLADGFTGLRVLDVSNPHLPGQIGALGTEGYAEAIVRQDDLVYLADNAKGLRIVDVSAPNTPKLLGIYGQVSGAVVGVAVSGTTAYIRDSKSGLLVLDVSDPAQPAMIGGAFLAGDGRSLEIHGSLLYVGDGWQGVRIVDVAEPTAPQVVGKYEVFGFVSALAVVAPVAYVAYGLDGVRTLDVSEPTAPVELGLVKPDGDDHVWQVRPVAELLYIANGFQGVRAFSTADPTALAEVATYDTLGYARDMDVRGAYVFVADGQNLLQVFEVGCASQ